MANKEISPELALVSPELSESERDRLPERPWEEAFDRTIERRKRPPAAGVRRTASGTRTSGSDRRRRRRLLGFGALALVASLVGFWALSGEGGPEAPTPAGPGSTRDLLAGPLRLLPNAGYVVSPSGSFLTARSGRRILTFTLPLRCGGRSAVIRDIPVSGRSFRVTRRAAGQDVTVRLTGRVVDRQQVAGSVAAVDGAGCAKKRVSFIARVS